MAGARDHPRDPGGSCGGEGGGGAAGAARGSDFSCKRGEKKAKGKPEVQWVSAGPGL